MGLLGDWLSGGPSMTHSEGLHFITRRIEDQAAGEGSPLSDEEKYMLRFSEEDPAFAIDEKVMQEFERAISDEEFERKITGLIRRAYDADIQKDKALRGKWKAAAKAVGNMDMYITVMLNEAL